jgi:hypothetical protein
MRSIPAAVIMSTTLLLSFTAPSFAQTIRLGPGGVEIAPAEPPPPPPVYREEIPRGERRFAPPPGVRDPLRVQMFQFRQACEDGDRRACVRLGVVIGENRERRAQWRRENPDLFFYER